jgi:hypothetical protein
MEEPRASAISPRTIYLSDGRWVALLLLLTLATRVWQVWHTEVTSRDSVGFIHIAWRLEHEDWRKVLPECNQHAGYPVAVLAVSKPIRQMVGGDLAYQMQLSAQITSGLASILLVVPMYYFGRELFSRRVAFWGTLLFQCFPATGKLMADGLSEPLFLLFASGSLLFGLRAIRMGSIGHFLLCGIFGGLAYLTRAEGALVPLVTGLTLLGNQFIPAWRRPWKQCLANGLALGLAAMVVAGPYMAAIGGVTRKPTFIHMTGRAEATMTPPKLSLARSPLPFAVWNYGPNVHPNDRYGWAFKAVGTEIVRGTFYVLWVPGLFGLWWFRDRFRQHPGAWALLLLWGILALLLYRVAQSIGYMSERHLVLFLFPFFYFATAGLGLIGVGLAVAGRKMGVRGLAGRRLALGILLLLAFVPLGKTLATLHSDRAGFRLAGQWLAENAEPDADVVDPYGWAGYYSGRNFAEKGVAKDRSVRYVVLEQSANSHPHLYHHLPEAQKLAESGTVMWTYKVRRRKENAQVIIYRVIQ